MAEEEFVKKLLKDKIAFGMVTTSLLFLLFGIFNKFGISFGSNFFTQAITLFSAKIWVIIALAVFLSSIFAYLKKYNLMIIILLLTLLSLTAFVRMGNVNELKDVTTNTWTLGPDLDPFLYLRHANEIVNGTLQNPDMMRSAPIGASNYAYASLMPWMIVFIFKIASIFSSISVTYAAIIAPVIFFCLSLLGFFLFMYHLSKLKFSKSKSLIISLFASILYSIIPSMVGRTVAGIPEIESLGMVWFWFSFLFYILAWKQKSINLRILFGVLAGIFTGLMTWSWGGYRFIYMTLSLTTLILFLFQKEESKNITIFAFWLIPPLISELLKGAPILSLVTRVSDTGFAIVVLLFLIVNWAINKPFIKKKFERIKLPTNIISIILILLAAIIVLFLFDREMLFSMFSRLIEGFLYPWGRSRIGLTVAENRAPYFSEVLGEFGNLIWIFLIGTIFLFYQAIKHFKKSEETEFEKWTFVSISTISMGILFYVGKVLIGSNYSQMIDQIDFLILLSLFFSLAGGVYFSLKRKINPSLNFSFLFLVLAIIFSRISSQSPLFNGESIFSKGVYFSGLLFFVAIVGLSLILAYRNKNGRIIDCFKEINLFYILILSFSFWAIISMRGAVRLFFIISSMIIIASSFIFAELYEYKKESNKKFIIAIFIILILAFAQIFTSYTSQTQYTVKAMVPSIYTQQWQNAMQWVRGNTTEESVFVHWWDYGYWVQTLGERATVVDGGQPIAFWNHLVGRYILTATSPEMALSMMKTHNVSYLLIDSSDIGKYPAFSKIGSDVNGEDRFAQIPLFSVDSAQTKETSNKTIRVYVGGGMVDEDILYTAEGESREIFIPKENSYLVFIISELTKRGENAAMEQSKAVFFYNNQQIQIPIRYTYYQGKIFDHKKGLNSTVYFIPKVSFVKGNQAQTDETGAAIYLSEKVTNSVLGQIYLLNSSIGRYSEFELAYSEPDIYMKYLNSMGLNLGDFAYVSGGLRGPIKIWEINPDENILVNEEFLRISGEYAEFDNLTFAKE